ncbi:DNA cytosine methyltransferase [Spirulina sp. CS-785/01]|nr:DNA cytosine methyltransferase [Spirulina sp. CS-785/01]MDB9312060.1 DNA cytosine methyltransferase [Spirulina sp. CS-785/01]
MKTVFPQPQTYSSETRKVDQPSPLTLSPLKFVDLFSGIGGFRLGLEQAGYQCVYSCEINPACQEVYYQNFGEYPDGDITKINLHNIPDFDVLTAGFPCQPFSICGKRQGFQDTRGTLFFYICELIEYKQPKVVLLENVKYLLHQDKGRTLDVILYSLEDLGYQVSYKLVNAKDFGVPQNRERVVIIATKDKKFDFDRLNPRHTYHPLKKFLCQSGNFEYLDSKDYTLIENPKQQKSGLIFVGYRSNKSIWKKGVRPNTEHLSRVHRQPNRIYSIDGLHPTIPSQETSGRFFIYIPEENAVRKLTIQECYKIMGFPENFKRHPNLGECYKQVGNSVCVPMVYELGIQIQQQIFTNNLENPLEKQQQDSSPVQLLIPGLVMNHKEKLLQIYKNSQSIDNLSSQIPDQYINYLEIIANNCFKKKGVYTVLVTLLVHKTLYPDQDIRYHQTQMKGGFSGRTIDTQYITPTLRDLGLPAMAESGWLTRSLEQPYPYTLDYNGNISSSSVKEAFLHLIDYTQSNAKKAEAILKILFYKIRKIKDTNIVKITKIQNPEKLAITTITHCLDQHFNFKMN